MTPRTAIAQIAKAIGTEMKAGGGPSRQAHAAGAMLAEGGAAPDLVACLFAEARRKAPRDHLINAYAFMLETAIDTLRIASNGGNTGAAQDIAAVRDRLTAELAGRPVEPATLLLAARAFAKAGLDPGDDLRGALVDGIEARSPDSAATHDPAVIANELASLAGGLGNDPFAIHQELAASAEAFPPDARAMMVVALANAGNEARATPHSGSPSPPTGRPASRRWTCWRSCGPICRYPT